MKIENFDDALKKKLENIDSSFDESDIQKVHNYVTRNSTLGRRMNLKRNFVLAGSGMIVIAMITWNALLVSKNKELSQNINKLHNELSIVNKPLQIANTNSISHKENISITTKKQTAQIAVQNYTAPLQSLNNNNNNITASVKNEDLNNGIEKINEATSSSTSSLSLSSTVTDEKTPVITQPNQATEAADIQVIKSIEVISNNNTAEIINKDSVISENKVVENTNSKTQDIAENNIFKKEEKLLLKAVHNFHYNTGVNFIAGRNQVGCGISGEALLKDRWGYSVGINVLGINNENYNDDQDFTNCKHTPFTSTYNLHKNDSLNHYFRIKINDVLFQLPLAINYHLELRHKFSLIVGAGTNLEVHVKQHVGYLHMFDSISKNDKLGHKFSPDLFNNIEFTAGIQKRYGLFLFQLCPYVSYQVKQVIYKKEELYYGLRIGIKFNFRNNT